MIYCLVFGNFNQTKEQIYCIFVSLCENLRPIDLKAFSVLGTIYANLIKIRNGGFNIAVYFCYLWSGSKKEKLHIFRSLFTNIRQNWQCRNGLFMNRIISIWEFGVSEVKKYQLFFEIWRKNVLLCDDVVRVSISKMWTNQVKNSTTQCCQIFLYKLIVHSVAVEYDLKILCLNNG